MTYTRTWDAAYEADPADSDNVGDGADQIRDLKTDVRERFAKDHYMDIAGTDADHGEHSKVTLRVQANDPLNYANKGFVYSKASNGVVEMYYRNSSGNITPITGNDGAYILKSVLANNSVLIANVANTPANLSVSTNRVVGRLSGSITALDAANIRTLINVANGATNGHPLGSWASRSANSSYLAATDGFMIGTIDTADYYSTASLIGYTDANATPVTKRCELKLSYRSPTASLTMPVKKGNYYRMVFSGSANSHYYYWIPMGA